jgi:transposase
MVDTLHEALETKALLPRDQLGDCGYTDAAILVESDRQYGVNILGPVAADPRWQAREETGFDNSAFTIDWATRTATCPRGKQRTKWPPDRDWTGQEGIQIRFAHKDCQACAVRSACTRAKTPPRPLAVRPQLYHEALQSMRKRQATTAFQEHYAARAGIEGPLSQGVRAFGRRRRAILVWRERICNRGELLPRCISCGW